MGKNQAYKALQRARMGSTSAGPEEIEDGMMDGSFHSPEWHAARLASLKTSHTITWEDFKKKQKEEELKKGELEADKDRMMREYRAQLDAEREQKLSRGRNHSGTKSHHKKGPSGMSYRTPGQGTIPCVATGPTSISASRSKHLRTFPVPNVRMGQDSSMSHSMRKPGQPHPTGFKTLIVNVFKAIY